MYTTTEYKNENTHNRAQKTIIDESDMTGKKGVLGAVKIFMSRNRLGELLVVKGYISPYDLKTALKLQKETKIPLGQIFLDQEKITTAQLNRLLFRQKTTRVIATMLLYAASLGAFSKKSQAAGMKDIPIEMTIASGNNFQNVTYHQSLFGASEKKSTNLKAFTKWSDMFERLNASFNDPSSLAIVGQLKSELAQYKSGSIKAMAGKVNTMMNKKKYIVDNKNWGKSDYWATPIEFMVRGGDCEDFAIAKYASLRALGVPENRLRIAIVQDMQKNIPHAVLIVYTEDGPMVLDNQIKTMKSASAIKHYKPIFSINREAWWLHTTPTNTSTIVASAR